MKWEFDEGISCFTRDSDSDSESYVMVGGRRPTNGHEIVDVIKILGETVKSKIYTVSNWRKVQFFIWFLF